ncbi:hypothetical protein SDC9_211238 [bioreactor metagenome]|uniref:Uncharacterized protein n=1 Tax=bioreactor metagenome TaxID=1076179 RepID=A0A645JL85_9ZZZZ
MDIHFSGTAAGTVGCFVIAFMCTRWFIGIHDLSPQPAGSTELCDLHEVVGTYTQFEFYLFGCHGGVDTILNQRREHLVCVGEAVT